VRWVIHYNSLGGDTTGFQTLFNCFSIAETVYGPKVQRFPGHSDAMYLEVILYEWTEHLTGHIFHILGWLVNITFWVRQAVIDQLDVCKEYQSQWHILKIKASSSYIQHVTRCVRTKYSYWPTGGDQSLFSCVWPFPQLLPGTGSFYQIHASIFSIRW
jgi:hypothetical protein